MMFCLALLNVLTAISAVFMVHEAVKTTGVDVFSYVLQALDLPPASPELFFRGLLHQERLGPETPLDSPVLTFRVEEIVAVVVVSSTTDEPRAPEEGVKSPMEHLVRVFRRVFAGLAGHASTLSSFWFGVLARCALYLRLLFQGLEAIGARYHDPTIAHLVPEIELEGAQQVIFEEEVELEEALAEALSETDEEDVLSTVTAAASSPVPAPAPSPVPAPAPSPVPAPTPSAVPAVAPSPVLAVAASSSVPAAESSPVPAVASSPVLAVAPSPVPALAASPVPAVASSPAPAVASSAVSAAVSSPVPAVASPPAPAAVSSPAPAAVSSPVAAAVSPPLAAAVSPLLLPAVSPPLAAAVSSPVCAAVSPLLAAAVSPLLLAAVSPPLAAADSSPVCAAVSLPLAAAVLSPVCAAVSPPVAAAVLSPVCAAVSPPVCAVVSPPVCAVVSPPVRAVVSPPVAAAALSPVPAVVSSPVAAAVSSPPPAVARTSIRATASAFVPAQSSARFVENPHWNPRPASRPLPPPFHINGFRPEGAGSQTQTPTPHREPNAAGQMFVPRPDRQFAAPPRPYPMVQTPHFGQYVENPHATFYHPPPAPFHVNGFRPEAMGFQTQTPMPLRQPNAAGQMFVPRPDRQSNRQRMQQPPANQFNYGPGPY